MLLWSSKDCSDSHWQLSNSLLFINDALFFFTGIRKKNHAPLI